MDTQYPVVNHSCKRQVVENLTTDSPNIGRSIFLKTLIIEPVLLGDHSRLVVAPYQIYSVWVPHFYCN